MQIAFISNTDLNHRKGGWDGLGGKIFDLLSGLIKPVILLDRINPPVSKSALIIYRLQKEFGIKRIFPAFSPGRLRTFSSILDKHHLSEFDHLFFHGATPWIEYKPVIPYSIVLDCAFSTYIKVYHQVDRFNTNYLKRIIDQERAFLLRAHSVFFTSRWAIEQTKKDYQIEGENFIYIGQGPSINIGEAKSSYLINQFLFVATDFIGKGGLVIFEGFKRFLNSKKGYKLILIGQKPPTEVLSHPATEFIGYVDKSTEDGRNKLAELYAVSKANILLTQKDILPLVVIESGYYGCPTIANPASAIPELIEHNKTGWLIDSKPDILAQTLLHISEMKEEDLLSIRQAVKSKMNSDYNWDAVIKRLIQALPREHTP